MKRITKIENETRKTRKTRAAAYCRVSTGSDEQLVSLEAQKQHYTEIIKSNPKWTSAGMYFDEGITGTKKDMEALVDEIETLYASRRKPVIFFSKGRYGEMDSLYVRIRNSFAHGNYFKVREYYYLWNETGSEGKLRKL